MSVINVKEIQSIKELESIAKEHLEDKKLKDVMAEIIETDGDSRVLTKAGVGYVIEEGFFGIGKNSHAGADIEHLEVEIKTSPLYLGKDGKLRIKEPLSLNIINYNEEYKNAHIKDSSLYRKNKHVLLVWYIHDKNIPRSEYKIKYVFVWDMDDAVLEELNADYLLILEKIKKGIAHEIHQSDHKYLTLCPKHNGKFIDPIDTKSKTSQPFSSSPAEVRAFRLKNSYMTKVIQRYLSNNHPEQLSEFVPE